jgi:phosphoribosylanthranilate isomerase
MKREALIIKVCGMREASNIRDIEALGIDWLGLIFWPKSSRYVSERPDYLPRNAKRVGVFVDEAPEKIVNISRRYGLDYIQLHGHESTSDINRLRQIIANQDVSTIPPQLIKAFSIATANDLEQTKAYEGHVDYFLFDTKGTSVGGNGVQFDWEVLTAYQGSTPFLLSGGIGPEDAERIRAFHHPRCIGIDLNSRFEIAPGLKDSHRLKTFLEQLTK